MQLLHKLLVIIYLLLIKSIVFFSVQRGVEERMVYQTRRFFITLLQKEIKHYFFLPGFSYLLSLGGCGGGGGEGGYLLGRTQTS